MNAGEKAELVAYKPARANERFSDVETLIQKKSWNAAVNRLCYACFYAVSALLINRGINARKHPGTRHLFGLNFITTGIISKESGKFYSEIFNSSCQGINKQNRINIKREIAVTLHPFMPSWQLVC